MFLLEVYNPMTDIAAAATTVTGYVGAAIAAGLGIGIVIWGARVAWRTVKSFGK